MEAVGLVAVAIEVIQNLVEKNQHRAPGLLDDASDRLGSRWCSSRLGPQRRDSCIAGQLAREVYPRRLAPVSRIPCVPNEDRYLRSRELRKPRTFQQCLNSRIGGRFSGIANQMIQSGQRMSLATAELGDEGENGSRV